MAAPLVDIRVVELANRLPVAYCGRQFALWGADVVRLEPSGGSSLRRSAPVVSADDGSEASVAWEYVSANKKVRRFEAREGRSRAELRALLESADVFLTDWPWDHLKEAGFEPSELEKQFPRLVILSYSDFRRTGPYAAYQATDLVLQALTGYMSFNGMRGRPPLKAPAHAVEYGCGVSAFAGVLAALRQRRLEGLGQLLEVSGMEATAALVQYTRTEYFGEPARRHGNNGPPMLPCADGHLFFNYMLDWSRGFLLLALGIDEANVPTDAKELGAFFSAHTRKHRSAELFRTMSTLGATCGAVTDADQLLEDEHLRARGFFRDYPTPAGTASFPGAAVHAGRTPMLEPRPAQVFRGWRAREEQPGANQTAGQALPRPLEGLRVLDVTQAWLGPYATMLLADLGAEVIKVESPTRPDVWRGVAEWPPCAPPQANRWNTGHFFNSVNRNKRSLTLDLADERGRALFLRLAERADLVMENYTPRVMENFGLGYDDLCKVNPDVVMVSFSGYGKSGPYHDFKAHGASIEAVSGWVSLFGYPDGDPITMGEYQVDPLAGLQMAASALAALLARDRSGEGQALEGSMMEAAVGYIGEEVILASLQPHAEHVKANRDRQMAPHGLFRCAGEDRWVAIAVRDDADWRALQNVMDDARLADSRYTASESRLALVDELEPLIEGWTQDRSPREVMELLQAAGVPAGAYQRTDEALDDPHLRHWFAPMTHADLGTHRYYGFPWSFSRARLVAELPPPRLGEQSAEVLETGLGLSAREVDELMAAKVTGPVLSRREKPAETAGSERGN